MRKNISETSMSDCFERLTDVSAHWPTQPAVRRQAVVTMKGEDEYTSCLDASLIDITRHPSSNINVSAPCQQVLSSNTTSFPHQRTGSGFQIPLESVDDLVSSEDESGCNKVRFAEDLVSVSEVTAEEFDLLAHWKSWKINSKKLSLTVNEYRRASEVTEEGEEVTATFQLREQTSQRTTVVSSYSEGLDEFLSSPRPSDHTCTEMVAGHPRFSVGDFHRLPSNLDVDEARCESDAQYRIAVDFIGLVDSEKFCEKAFTTNKTYRNALNLLAGRTASVYDFSESLLQESSCLVSVLRQVSAGRLDVEVDTLEEEVQDEESEVVYCELNTERPFLIQARGCGLQGPGCDLPLDFLLWGELAF